MDNCEPRAHPAVLVEDTPYPPRQIPRNKSPAIIRNVALKGQRLVWHRASLRC